MEPFEDGRFAELLRPIKDLTENFTIPLSHYLDVYYNELKDGLSLHSSVPDTKINFVEAGFLLQSTVSVYSKKVELLWQTLLKLLSFLSENDEKPKEIIKNDTNNSHNINELSQSSRIETLQPVPLNFSKNTSLSQNFKNEFKMSFLPKIPIQFLEKTFQTNGVQLFSHGSFLGYKHDFKVNEICDFETGMLGKDFSTFVESTSNEISIEKICFSPRKYSPNKSEENDEIFSVENVFEAHKMTSIVFSKERNLRERKNKGKERENIRESLRTHHNKRSRKNRKKISRKSILPIPLNNNNTSITTTRLQKHNVNESRLTTSSPKNSTYIASEANEEEKSMKISGVSFIESQENELFNENNHEEENCSSEAFEEHVLPESQIPMEASTELMTQVTNWKNEIQPILKALEKRTHFEISQYEDKILTIFSENVSKVSFKDIMKEEKPEEISRYFLSCLNLANSGNLSLESSHKNEMNLTLLSQKRLQHNLIDSLSQESDKKDISSHQKRAYHELNKKNDISSYKICKRK